MTKVDWHGDAFLRKLIPSFEKGLTAAAAQMDDQAVGNFGRDGSPSKPGGVPGIDTGHLRNSIRHASPTVMGTPLQAAFGTATKYGRFLEFGTRNMAARPWIWRAAFEAKLRAMKAFEAVYTKDAKAKGLIK